MNSGKQPRSDTNVAMKVFNEAPFWDVVLAIMPTRIERVLFCILATIGGLGLGMLQAREMYIEMALLTLVSVGGMCVLGRRYLVVVFLYFWQSRKGS